MRAVLSKYGSLSAGFDRLILFVVPVLMTRVAPCVTGILRPGSVYGFLQKRSLEVLLLIGLFMLRGEFWGKLSALFKHPAKVEFVAETSATPA